MNQATRYDYVAALEKKLSSPNDAEDIFESLANEFYEQFVSDEETFAHKGRNLCLDFKQHPQIVDDVLVTLCRWTMKSLLPLPALSKMIRE